MTSHVTPEPAVDRAAAAPRVAVSSESGRALWIGLGAVGLAAVLVFWLFDALAFQDLPAHAGLIAMRHRFAGSPFEQRFFVLSPHIGPYTLFRFLGEGLVGIVGPTGAVRVIATLPVVATPAAMLFARRRLFGDRSPTMGYLGIVLSFGFMTLLGFASYLLGVAVMLVGLTLWLELMVAADGDPLTGSARARRLEIAVALYAPLIFIAHGHAFLLFLGLAVVSCLAAGHRIERTVRLRALAPALLIAARVAWIERGSSIPRGSAALANDGLAPYFQGPYDKLSLLVTPTLMTRTGIDIAIGVFVWALVVAGAVATLRWMREVPPSEREGTARLHSRALYAGAASIALLFLVLPHRIGWFGFVDGRLVPLIVILAALAVHLAALGPQARAAFERGVPLLACATAALALVASYRFQAEARGYKEVLAAVPSESRLLNLPLDPNSDIFTAHPFVHYDKLVLAQRPLVVSDIWFHQGSALYPTPENPALRLPSSYSESNLRFIDWPAYRLGDWDYVLIRTRPDAPAPFAPAGLSLEKHAGGWWLYRTPAGA
jgi:hypothetical protein